MAAYDFERLIVDIPDYPEPGVVFKDITPLLADSKDSPRWSTRLPTISRMRSITKVIGAEARGFMVGAGCASS
ncbi:MAG: hypothetical protein ACLT98_05435 [Eggerthellaceae bacterium]